MWYCKMLFTPLLASLITVPAKHSAGSDIDYGMHGVYLQTQKSLGFLLTIWFAHYDV